MKNRNPFLPPKIVHGKKWMPAMYVAYFGALQEIVNNHGYALCVHGSIVGDFDLIAVPFDDIVSPHERVLEDIIKMVGLEKPEIEGFRMQGCEPHGRMCYAIECGGGGYFDISFTPSLQQAMEQIMKDDNRKSEMQKVLNYLAASANEIAFLPAQSDPSNGAIATETK